MLIFGAILIFFGLLLSFTIIGAVIGIPLMILGMIFVGVGYSGRRRMIITNVVQVANAPQAMPMQQPAFAPAQQAQAMPLVQQSVPIPVAIPQPSLIERTGPNCPACASANDPGSRFCNNCGTSLSAARS